MRSLGVVIGVLLLALSSSPASTSGRRVALVLGNGAYKPPLDLPNAPTDARAVAAALRRLEFVVIEGIDLSNAEMQARLKEFSREMEGAEVGLFYYAGHGMQVGGENYLIPIDANPKRERDLDFETLKLDLVMRQLLREAKIKIVILDSCRDNPMATELSRSMASSDRSRSTSVLSGMGAINTQGASGTLVAFATAPGTVALDGKGAHSPFTSALLAHIETPGVDIDVMMKRVRGEVTKGTNERQVPWTNSSLVGEFQLAPGGKGRVASATPAATPQSGATEDDSSVSRGADAPPSVAGNQSARADRATTAPPRSPDGKISGRRMPIAVAVEAHPSGGGGPSRSWVGVNIEDVSQEWARTLGLATAGGAFVTGVEAGSPAARSELRFGDVVLNAGNTEIRAVGDLPRHVQTLAPGSSIVLEVWRIWEPGGDFLHSVTRLAERGSLEAMAKLGAWYASGFGVGQNDIEATRWLRPAAEGRHPVGMLLYGQMLIAGRGTVKDAAAGAQWIQSAAKAGQPSAMHLLGLLYIRGDGIAKNPAEATRWLRQAADSKHAPAMFQLGNAYQEGIGVGRDLATALRWYSAAADLGNAAAMASLGLMHSNGTGVTKDDAAAVRWYRKASDAGNAMAHNNLALLLDRGVGATRDFDEAARLIMLALDQQFRFSFDQMMKNAGAWSPEFRRALQRRLKDAGFYNGALDGEFGQGTQAAIIAYATRQR